MVENQSGRGTSVGIDLCEADDKKHGRSMFKDYRHSIKMAVFYSDILIDGKALTFKINAFLNSDLKVPIL